MVQHSLLGASGASRWLACPGSFKLSQTVTPGPSSSYAMTGSIAHELIEEAANNNFKLKPGLSGTTRDIDGVDIPIDQDMLDSVEVMLEYARARTAKRLYRSEMKVSPRLPFKLPVEVFGWLDLIIVDPIEGWFEIIDYKHGAGVPVKAERNAQLLFYAAGALAMIQKIAKKIDIHEAILTVVQPRVPGEPAFKQWTINVLDLELWVADVLVPGIEACLEEDAGLLPGAHCRFCPALSSCPALLWKAQETAKGEFDIYDGQLPGPMTLSEQLILADQLETWMEALRGDAKRKLEKGDTITGWRLVPTRATRKWKDENLVAQVLIKCALPPDKTHRTELLSPAQMEKSLVKTYGRPAWDKEFQPLIEVVSSGTKLARTENDTFDLLEAIS